ncbi:MAG: hypothetical protein ACTHMI_24035 [Mucilaginibacter sp.]
MKDQLATLLEPYDPKLRSLIYQILEEEQKMISFKLGSGSLRLQDIKNKIRQEIEKISDSGYEA